MLSMNLALAALAAWLTRPENPFFAKSLVSWIWREKGSMSGASRAFTSSSGASNSSSSATSAARPTACRPPNPSWPSQPRESRASRYPEAVASAPQSAQTLVHLRRARDLMDRDYALPLDVPTMAAKALMGSKYAGRCGCRARARATSPPDAASSTVAVAPSSGPTVCQNCSSTAP